jgi:hypothetical protein
MQTKKLLIVLLAALAVFGLVRTSQAGLYAVDPGPYVTAYGFFPQWYQDTNGRALELCLAADNIAANARPGLLGGAACTLLANLGPPVIFDPALPMVFPTNFPDESFWFMGDATITTAGGVDLTYVSALEAAFGTGLPAVNDQISFARIRIRVTLPTTAPAGTYTVTHPYGIERFEVLAGGVKVINMTRDIGIGGAGDFTGALKGDIGPFLMDASVPTDGLILGSLGGLFIGDPNTPRPVVGSPFGTNFVRLEGPAGFTSVETNLFTVMGKVFPGALATPLIIERSTYSRTNGTTVVAQEDVFAKAPPTSNPVSFVDTDGVAIGMTDDDANSGWFGQSPANPVLPATISVSATNAGNNNTAVTKANPLVDLVTITRAEYNAGTLLVEATSSDAVQLPQLSVNGQLMTLVGTGPLQTITISGLIIPPARVTVTSANGGSDTEEVALLP